MNPKAKSFKTGNRKSKYDKYQNKIIELAGQGWTVIQILDQLEIEYGEYDVTQAGLYNYIKTRNLKHLTRKRIGEEEKVCDGCQWCEKLQMCNGNVNRFCMLEKRQIFHTTTTSPMWCSKSC